MRCIHAGGETFSSSSFPQDIIPRDVDDGVGNTNVVIQINSNNPYKNWWERMALNRREIKIKYSGETC